MTLTLPNPDMVFVPLDILTADEMNKMVANTQYIANQFPIASANIADSAVTGAKIASNTVKSQNIDWTTIPYGLVEKAITINSSGVVGASFTAPEAGVYLCMGTVSLGFMSSDGNILYSKIQINGVDSGAGTWLTVKPNYAGNSNTGTSMCSTIAQVPAGGTIAITCGLLGNSRTSGSCQTTLIYVKVAG